MTRPASLAAMATLALALLHPGGLRAQLAHEQAPKPPPGEAAASSDPLPALVAFPLGESMKIDLDGRLDEEVWQDAVPITDFTQQEPVEGATPSEKTEVRVAYDQDNLYIGAMIYDDPDGILAFQRQRDAGLNTDDRFQWILDTFDDGRTGYFFEINAAGLMGDGLIGGGGGFGGGRGGPGRGGGFNKAWDGIWEARTARLPNGWSAEIRIPFRTLNFDPTLTEWGINFQRTIRRKNEEILWRGFRRNQGLRSPVFAGKLTGLTHLSQGLGLEAVPSTVASWRNVPCADASGCVAGYDETTFPKNVSLDLNYSVTSSLRASLSINTDFAEVESDQRQVNLTRFPLRFPEQRGFFLEGSGVFDFAPGGGASPFYSRNIGLDSRSGQQLPILYGTRLTGQVSNYELGFYQIQTGNHTYFSVSDTANVTIPGETFTVARVKRRLFEQSSIGAIYTRRSRAQTSSGTTDANTVGLDLDLSTRHFLGDNNLDFRAFVAWNSDLTSDPSSTFANSFGRLSARGAELLFPNDPWSGSVSYREFGDDYDPALGFVTRNGYRRTEEGIGWSPRPAGIAWIRNFNFRARFMNQWTMDTGRIEQQDIDLNLLGINFESGDGIDFSVQRSREYLDYDFNISSGVPIYTGDYAWWEYHAQAHTGGQRKVGFFTNFTWGGFWNGDRTQLNGRVMLRAFPAFNLSANFEHNDVSLPTGAFTANVYGLEGQWNPSPWVGLTNQLQYDDVSQVVGLFSRLRWIVRPGNDIYLVYTHNWQNYGAGLLADPQLRTLSQGASIKLNYTYRF